MSCSQPLLRDGHSDIPEKGGFLHTRLLSKARTLLRKETAMLSCQADKAVSFCPGLIAQESTPFHKQEVLGPGEGPTSSGDGDAASGNLTPR